MTQQQTRCSRSDLNEVMLVFGPHVLSIIQDQHMPFTGQQHIEVLHDTAGTV